MKQPRLWIDHDDTDDWRMDEGLRLVGLSGVQQTREAMKEVRSAEASKAR